MRAIPAIIAGAVGAASTASAFVAPPSADRRAKPPPPLLLSAKKKASGGGFGGGGGLGGGGGGAASKGKKKGGGGGKRGNLAQTLADEPRAAKKSSSKGKGTTYVKSEQDALLADLAASAASTPIGRAVTESPMMTAGGNPEDVDQFWELIPSLLSSKFPTAKNNEWDRLAGFVRHALDPNLPLEEGIIEDKWRPHTEMHAYMPGLGPREPFLDPNRLDLCSILSENIDVIEAEYDTLLEDMSKPGGQDRFQSVTSMNYESGWRTLVLFYNGHRIPDFPYHLCPVTTRILETVPLAGRIAGFNRQQPRSGIPLHSDGNNMWLTCQMGIKVPSAASAPSTDADGGEEEKGGAARIRVGPETRRWSRGECLLYDTTYEHETFNESEEEERVVLHVDFFNTLAMTPLEIDAMRYIYSMREEFMKAEGVAKVGAQIL